MKKLTMNEVQDLLWNIDACAYDALEAFIKDDLAGCKTALKAIIAITDELAQSFEDGATDG